MAFVHLHNHSDYSMLDGATRVGAMVDRAVELGMPAVALTDHGYMYGIPDLDIACRGYNESQADWQQWFHDKDNWEHGRPVEEPQPGEDDYEVRHAQWARDVACHEAGDPMESVRPAPLIKPIFGCEVYFTPDETLAKGAQPTLYHLILLAKNEVGYVNLMELVSEAATTGFYYKPRVTLDNLRRHSEGLIGTSACVAGIIPRSIMEDDPAEALKWARTFKETFAPGDFYLEVQEHRETFTRSNFSRPWTDREISEQIVALARQLDIKIIATNDFHYLTRESAGIQDVVQCIGMGKTIDDPQRMRMTQVAPGEGEYYMKTEEEMRELFDWLPEACDNTLEIAEKCSVGLEWGRILLPAYPLDPGETNESQFRRECEDGLAKRYGEDWRTARPDVVERFEYEYKVICDKGFAAYFLIVQEYVRWAKENGIGVGPGRGSAAGAIVAYAMDITTFDPLANGLLFERFLSPERSEMPDIDMDFDDERRLDVIQHVREVYGADHVTHVITYSTLGAKAAVKDSARVLDKPIFVADKISKMIPEIPGIKLKQVLHKDENKPERYSPDLVQAYKEDPDVKEVVDTAFSIEGLIRGEGVHACAVLISPDPVNEHVPTKLDTKGGVEITQYEGHTVADMGLLKMDFLGLRTLTVISKALANIKENHGIDIDVDSIPFDDPKIFELLGSGHTAGVFQVESGGMTATIKSMQPREYKHVVALIALYRPGPLGAGMVDSYVNRMNGKEDVVFYDPRLSDILDETYGTMVYQEQVMRISVTMCGFSAGESDSRIRKPVAKKKIKLLTSTVFHWDNGADETTYDHWMNGAEANGYKREVAQRIWDDVLEFASYAFNKSHSAGYAILVMQTAWLKAHYPHEFMAAVLTSYTGKTDKITHYVAACRKEGIPVLAPDINESGIEFTATEEGVRFGLAGMKGVGVGAAECIIAEREAHGPFTSLHDFVDRVDGSQANRRVIEALIKSGAFDSTGYPRMQLMGFTDKADPSNIIDAAASHQKQKAQGQASFFDLMGDDPDSGFSEDVPPADPEKEWDRLTKLAQEKDVLGIYVSDHPLRPYEYALAKARDHTIGEMLEGFEVTEADGSTHIAQVNEKKELWIAGMANSVALKTTKKGDRMAVVTLEDLENEIDVVVFPKTFKKAADILSQGGDNEGGDLFIRVHGRLDRSDRGDQFLATEVELLELDEKHNKPKVMEVLVPGAKLTRPWLQNLSNTLERHRGLDRVELFVDDGTDLMRMTLPCGVDAHSVVLYAEVDALVGREGKVVLA